MRLVRWWRRATVATAVAALLVLPACTRAEPAPDATGTGLRVPRAVHRATPLADGRVLLTGGCTAAGCEGTDAAARTELVDPGTGRSVPGPRLRQPRLSHTATSLPDGRVLVIGGYPGEGAPPTASMEIVDVARHRVLPAGRLRTPRADHTATLLASGLVLVAGGRGSGGNALRSVELVDPGHARTTVARPLPVARTAHTATTVGGRVLLVGGTGSGGRATRTTVAYDPGPGTWTPGPPLRRARVKHAAVALPDGELLVAGGAPDAEGRTRFRDTELLRPETARFRPGPALTDGRYKLADAAVVLPDGRVVLGGGPALDVLDLRAGTVRTVRIPGAATRLAFQTVTRLTGSRVLVAGGYDDAIVPTSAAAVVTVS